MSGAGSAPAGARWLVGGDIGAGAPAPRGRVRADLVYLGWQHLEAAPDPGPAPAPPPAPSEPDGVSADWVAAQRREHSRLAWPDRLTSAVSVSVAITTATTWLAGPITSGVALLVAGAATWTGLTSGRRLWRGRRVLAARFRAEEVRTGAFQEAQRCQLAARQDEHARQVRNWKQRSAAFRRQPQWYPVTLPTSVHRVDVAGGTLAGWSALLTMIAAPRLAAGGEVTVLDLTEGGVATDLLAVARRSGIAPVVWVLPADLPQLDLVPLLAGRACSRTCSPRLSAPPMAPGPGATSLADPVRDAALLGGVLRALGGEGDEEAHRPCRAYSPRCAYLATSAGPPSI